MAGIRRRAMGWFLQCRIPSAAESFDELDDGWLALTHEAGPIEIHAEQCSLGFEQGFDHRLNRASNEDRRVLELRVVEAIREIRLQLVHGPTDIFGGWQRVGDSYLSHWFDPWLS